MNLKRKRTLAIEIGMQNAGLGTALAHFDEKTAMPPAIFVFVCIITASVMAEIWQKQIPEQAVE
jgi:BASS family bile acid:Na+ symporter